MTRQRSAARAISLVAVGLVAVALIGMLGCAGLMLSRIYDGPLAPRLLLGAAAAAVALGVATWRAPSWSAAPVSVLGLVGYLALSVRLSASSGGLSGGTLDLIREAVRNGIPRILTAMIPIRPDPDTIVVPVLVVWLAGLAGIELALRSRRILLSYAPAAALVGVSLYLVGPNARPTPWLALAFAGFAALGLAAANDGGPARSGGQSGSPPRLRLTVGAVGGLFAIMVAAAGLGPAVAGRVSHVPGDPRRYVTPPQLDSLDESPLARLSGWALDPGQHLFDARLTGERAADVAGLRIRLAVLGNYDGVTWRVAGNYRTAGRVLAGPPAAGGVDPGTGREVTQRITIDQLGGRLLPAAATPARIEGVRAAYDPHTTTLALPEGLRPGVAYTVTSRRPTVEVNLLPTAQVPHDDATVRGFVKLGGDVPTDQQRLAEQIAEGASTPYQRAVAIERFLAEHYRQVSDAPSGHAYPNLSFFLFGPRNGGGQRGTSEQFAAAFAVLARMLGLPTRLVVGFTVEPGRPAVRGADALAWPEVLFDGVGWVPFNPLPEPNSRPRNVEDDFRPSPTPTTPPPSTRSTPPVSSAPPTSSAAAPTVAAGSGAGGRPIAAVATVGGVLLLAGLLAAVALARRVRSRRRLRRGDPPSRVLGAWWEVVDALRQAGRRAPASLTANELAGYAEAVAGCRPGTLGELADLVNVVAFAPATVDRTRADAVVTGVTGYVRSLRSGLPRWRRLLLPLDPRPLWWEWRRSRAGAISRPVRPLSAAYGDDGR